MSVSLQELLNIELPIIQASMGEVSPFPLAATAIGPLRSAAEAAGLGDFSPLWSGQNASGCREISAAQLTRKLAQGL